MPPEYTELQLTQAPKRGPKVDDENASPGLPAPGEAAEAAIGEDERLQSHPPSMMENIRLLRVLAEVEKAVGEPPSSESGPNDTPYLDDDDLMGKDGQSSDEDSANVSFFSPIAHNEQAELLREPNVEDHRIPNVNQSPMITKLAPREELHFNVDIFKSSNDGRNPVRDQARPRPPEVDEELHPERWECLQQLERRATEASLEGLRKASLRGNDPRAQSLASVGLESTHSSPSRKLSSSRQNDQHQVGTDRKPSWLSIRNRLNSHESKKSEPKALNLTSNPGIVLTHSPQETDDISQKEKLLLRSPSVSVMPILQEITSPPLPRNSWRRPLSPRAISQTYILSYASEQNTENGSSIPLAKIPSDSTMKIDLDEKEVISIPSSAIRQMIRTSQHLINRKNSINYANLPPTNLRNADYQDDLNHSNDDLAQPSLIEISLNKADPGAIDSETQLPKAPPPTPEKKEEFPVALPDHEVSDKTNEAGETIRAKDYAQKNVPSSFRRLSIGDGRTIPRDKRYRYMKTHPALPPHGPSSPFPQLPLKDSKKHDQTRIYPRIRSISLGEARTNYHSNSKAQHQQPEALRTYQDPTLTLPRGGLCAEGSGVDRLAKSKDQRQPSNKPLTHFKNTSFADSLSNHPVKNQPLIIRTRQILTSREEYSSSINQADRSRQLYELGGIKSQSEPSLGFLGTSTTFPSQFGRSSSSRHRKLKKKSQTFHDPNLALPPLPTLPSSLIACSHPYSSSHPYPYSHPYTYSQSFFAQPKPCPKSNQPKNKKNFLNLKHFWRSLIHS